MEKKKENFCQSFKFAFSGLKTVYQRELNFKIHLLIALMVIFLGLILKLKRIDWLILFITIGLVLTAELFNSTIEYLIDLVSPQYHNLAKDSKDAAAAAVLLLSFISIIIGLIIFLPYLK